MRLPESKIKSAILHPNEDVRLTAVGYFSDAYSEDQTVMPLVIEAVEKYGRDCAFRILRDAERLHQTEETVKWLSSELRRDYNTKEIAEDNYRCAVAISLCQAQVGLLSISFCDLLFPERNERDRYGAAGDGLVGFGDGMEGTGIFWPGHDAAE